MFTGIVETTASVLGFSSGGVEGASRLTLERPADFNDLKFGSSVSVSGACLSIVELEKKTMSFDVVSETLKRTTLGSLKEGDGVNLERALRVGGRFEGHIVQGHVDGVGEITRVMLRRPKVVSTHTQAEPATGATLTIEYPRELRGLIVEKGSIAVDGVSLTVTSVRHPEPVEGSSVSHSFTVSLIPHTLDKTTLGSLKEGDRVNLEVDIVGRYLRK